MKPTPTAKELRDLAVVFFGKLVLDARLEFATDREHGDCVAARTALLEALDQACAAEDEAANEPDTFDAEVRQDIVAELEATGASYTAGELVHNLAVGHGLGSAVARALSDLVADKVVTRQRWPFQRRPRYSIRTSLADVVAAVTDELASWDRG